MLKINSDIKNNNLKQMYLIYGDEQYLKRQYTKKLKDALAGSDEMNVHIYDGKDTKEKTGEIIDLAETMPFLAERRVFLISNSGLFKAGGDALSEYLSEANGTAFFVFTESEVDKRTKLFKAVSSKGYSAEFKQPAKMDIEKWLLQKIKKENMNISESTMKLFLDYTGSDMDNMDSELDKLICYCMGREIITSEDVEAICTRGLSSRIFEMIDFMSTGKTTEALALYYDLLALKEPEQRIRYNIARHMNQLLLAKDMRVRGYDNKKISEGSGIPEFYVGKYLAQASKFKSEDLKRAVKNCVEADEAVKNGRISDRLSVELLIVSALSDK